MHEALSNERSIEELICANLPLNFQGDYFHDLESLTKS